MTFEEFMLLYFELSTIVKWVIICSLVRELKAYRRGNTDEDRIK